MRVALVSPLYETVPPTHYGGTERVIAALGDELVRRGHEVTLFAAHGSRTAARLEPMVAEPLRSTMSRTELERVAPHLHLGMLAQVYGRAAEFDVIHAHVDLLALPFAGLVDTPTLVTLHGRLDLAEVQRVLPTYGEVAFASISDAQRTALAGAPVRWIGTCYNGLDLDAYLATPRRGGDYLAFVGRITPEKRPDRAIHIARATGMPLRIAAKVDPLDLEYWTDEIQPLLATAHVEFLGEIDEAAKPGFYAGAAATLMPIDWPEPFGLVMIESLAAGTPVIALNNGSVPEIVTDGRCGFVCDDVEQMIAAVGRVGELDPEVCRDRARCFDARAMTDRYEIAYSALIAGGGASIDLGRLSAPAPLRGIDGGPSGARSGIGGSPARTG